MEKGKQGEVSSPGALLQDSPPLCTICQHVEEGGIEDGRCQGDVEETEESLDERRLSRLRTVFA